MGRNAEQADIVKLYDFFAKSAVKIFNDTGEHPPTIFMATLGRPGEPDTIAMLPPELVARFFVADNAAQASAQKNALGAFTRGILTRGSPFRNALHSQNHPLPDVVIIITEAWGHFVSFRPTDDVEALTAKAREIPPSEHPDRKECVAIQLLTPDGSFGWQLQVDESRKIAYEPLPLNGKMIAERFGVQEGAGHA